MPDDLANFHPLDPGRVNLLDPMEVRYWCAQLECNESQLREAVAQVGEHVTQLRGFLKKA